MMDAQNPPVKLTEVLSGQKTDFVIQSKRAGPPISYILIFIMGFWMTFFGLFPTVPFIIASTRGSEGERMQVFLILSELVSRGWPMILAAVLFALIFIAGIITMIYAIIAFFRPGPWIAATQKSLYICNAHGLRELPWDTFTGDITVRERGGSGWLILQQKSGGVVRGRYKAVFVHNTVLLYEIFDPHHIEKICRRRITGEVS